MFLPSKIEKIRLIMPKIYYDKAVTLLGELGFLQIEVLESESKKILNDFKEIEYDKINKYSQKIRSLESSLVKQKTVNLNINNLKQVFHEVDKIKIYEEVNDIKKEEEKAKASIKESASLMEILNLMKGFKRDLRILNGMRVESFIMKKTKEKAQFAGIVKKEIDCEFNELENSYIFTIEKYNKEKLANLANKEAVNLIKVPEMKGRVAETIELQQANIKKEEEKLASLNKRLEKLSKKYYGLVSNLKEYLDIEIKKASIIPKVGSTDYITVIEGWMETKKIQSLEESLDKLTEGQFVLEKIKTNEEPPTKMENPVSFKLYEFFIKFYSIPKSSEIDPTIFFGIAFPIFFGLMVGDAGYGATFLLLSFWLVHRIKHPPKKSHIPRKLAKFVKTIISKNSLVMIMKAIVPGSAIAVVLGIIFNEYFGFSLPYTPLFDVTKSVSTLLLISGWIGVAMVSFGFVLGALNALYNKKVKKAVGRIGWLLVAWGIVIVGLAVLHKESIGLSNLEAIGSYVAIIIGILLVLKSEGTQSLMEIPSVISHILSYTRLVGILLASVILAQVINLIFVSSLSGSIPFIIGGVVILVFGQLFNIVIALFEGGIQGARLIYVEFFSKFFEGNGNMFKPFKIERRNTANVYVKNVKRN
ncbi:MAG: V-type ATP synthase subunit I [Candidatus Parvarchaeota archaeon]|jgi:V/A-type H+-transporting ATPase subunit I|nr:V-type ATP synthase subunit I [Candidatus Parvarchaeota archaeon]MCL5106558.1 V-type ATP synthase subunit I [Candidatus Parvarchaeota archaeon]